MKKFLIVAVCCFLILRGLPPIFVSAAAPSDGRAHAQELLTALGIIGDDQKPNEAATRAEVIKAAAALMKRQAPTGYGRPVFTDVPQDHWAYDAIMSAYSLGFVSGGGNGELRPDDPATPGEAKVILVNFLGYKTMAALLGGGDAMRGYSLAAGKLELAKGVSADGDMPLTKGDLFRMLYNALFVTLPDEYVSGGKIYFDSNGEKGKTALEKLYEVYYEKGVVTANEFVSIDFDAARKGHIVFGGRQYACGAADTSEYIGCAAGLYYKKESADELLVVYLHEIAGEKREFSARDISYDAMRLTFAPEGQKAKTYKISADTSVIVNNRLIDSSEYEQKLNLGCGKVFIIDNNSDGIYDVVNVKSPTVIMADTYDGATGILSASGGEKYALDSYKKVVVRSHYGEEVSRAALNHGDILSILDPGGEDYTLIIDICGKKIAGKIEEIDYGANELTLGGGLKIRYFEAALTPIAELRVGGSYDFTCNPDGEAVYGELSVDDDYKVAYMIGCQKDDRPLSGVLKLKLLTVAEGIRTVLTVNSVKLRDRSGITEKRNADKALLALDGGAAQPIAYKQNAQGDVTEILQLAPPGLKNLVFRELDWRSPVASDNATLKYSKDRQSLSGRINFSAAAKYFLVPNQAFPDPGDEDYYVKTSSYSFLRIGASYPIDETENNSYYPIPISMAENGMLADYFVFKYPSVTSRIDKLPAYSLAFVADITVAYDAEKQEEYTKLSLIGTSGSVIAKPYLSYDGDGVVKDINGAVISKGDIVLQNTDYTACLTNRTVQLYYRGSDGLTLRETPGTYDVFGAYRMNRARIEEKENGYAKVTILRNTGAEVPEIMNFSGTTTVVYDRGKNKISTHPGALTKLAQGDEVMLIIAGGLPQLAIKYE